MLFRQVVTLVKELYLHGGIEIYTRCDGISREDSSIGAQTLIQPDGDIITKVSENACFQPAIWQRHLENVEQKIFILQRFRRFLKWISFSIPAFLSIAYAAWTAKREAVHFDLWDLVIIGSLFGFFLFLIRPFASFLLRWYIRRWLNKS